jgi:hypothetical protein
MNSNAVAQQTAIAGVPTDWHIVGQRDFNADGNADILWYNITSGTVVVWLMNGLSVTQSVTVGTVAPASGWVIAGASDFNGDGNADILWRNGTNVAIWFLTNGVATSSATVGTVPLDWQIKGTSADGHILWQQDVSGAITIWDMTGVTVSQSHNVGSVPQSSGWAIVGAGDFDGDGHGDLLWKNTNGAVAIWFVVSGAVTSSANVTTVADPAWSINLTGDFDGDGKSDIVWTNTTNGARVLWRMDGATILQSLNIATVPISWDIQWMAAE